MDEKAIITIDSKYKNVQYHMYNDRIIVKSNNSNNNKCLIKLPLIDKVIGFYDMYYVSGYIHVIIATRGDYDIRYILNEDEMKLVDKQLSK